jgi:ribonuclease VapC
MIVDTSAVMAILRQESDASAFGAALAREPRTAISAATLVELCMVAESRAGAPCGPRSRR